MADSSSEAIGIDFADPADSSTYTQLLEFAGFAVTTDVDSAPIVIGDRREPVGSGAYISLAAQPGPNTLALAPPLRLTPLLALLAEIRGRIDDPSLVHPAVCKFVGASAAAVRVRENISKAAQRDVTVLVTGESGTGKEVVARALHASSSRANGPFMPINCGAIPADLLESELFGHEKGAFTGAVTQKTGRFELAHGGTLFLDEVGDMPFAMQVKLLRALENKTFERVGGAKSHISDVRIIAATHQDLESRINTGEFREDLFYRLNVFPIELAPLRERTEDLGLLVDVLSQRIQAEQNIAVRLSVDALEMLAKYPWPGNVRELSNLLSRLAIQYPNGLVRKSELPERYRSSSAPLQPSQAAPQEVREADDSPVQLPVNGIDLKDYLTRLEKSLIEQALQDTNAIVARAADRLHIRRTTLVEKMRKHGLGRSLDAPQ